MKKLITKYAFFILIFTSCAVKPKLSPLQRYKEAMEFYEKKEYANAAAIFREIRVPLMGRNEEIDVLYYLAMCYYHREEYIRAAYAFKDFFDTFPTTQKAEEALFLEGESLYKESPYSNLDQSITHDAIESLNLYIVNYPNGRFIEQTNKYFSELNNKLAKKDFDNLTVFYNLEYYSSTVVCCDNFMKDHINSSLQAEVLFMKIMSLCKLYTKYKSNPSRAAELRLEIIKSSTEFSNLYADSKHIADVSSIANTFSNPMNDTK